MSIHLQQQLLYLRKIGISVLLLSLLLSGCQPIRSVEHTNQLRPAATELNGNLLTQGERQLGEPIATLTHFEGDIVIESPGASRRTPGLMSIMLQGQKPSRFHILRNGSKISSQSGGTVTIVCYNGMVVRVAVNGVMTVTEQMCGQGVSVPAQGGGANPQVCEWNSESCAVRKKTREQEKDYGNVPIILNPRNTQLITVTPELQWVSVSDTLEYELSLSSPNPYPVITLEVDKLTCAENELARPHQICTIGWPVAWPLEMGQTYFIEVSARTGIAVQLRPSEKSQIHTLSVEEAVAVQKDVDALLALDLDPATQHALLAGLYVQQQLYADAIVAYQTALLAQPAALLYVNLGNVYRAVDLQRFSFNTYKAALSALTNERDEPLIRASAEFGQGQVEYSRQNFKAAAKHYQEAVKQFNEGGGKAGLAAAQNALIETEKRLQ